MIFSYFIVLQSGGSGAGLAPLVEFYSKLPKGSATATASKGIRGRFFEGKNASAAPLAYTILAIGGFGYAIDYNSAYSYYTSLKTANNIHIPSSAPEYALFHITCEVRLLTIPSSRAPQKPCALSHPPRRLGCRNLDCRILDAHSNAIPFIKVFGFRIAYPEDRS